MTQLHSFDITQLMNHIGLPMSGQSAVLQNISEFETQAHNTSNQLFTKIHPIKLDLYQVVPPSLLISRLPPLQEIIADLNYLNVHQHTMKTQEYLSTLFQCTDFLITHINQEIKSLFDCLYTQRLRWIDQQHIIQQIIPESSVYSTTSFYPIQQALHHTLKQTQQYKGEDYSTAVNIPKVFTVLDITQHIQNDHHSLLKRSLQFLLTPTRLQRLQTLKTELFTIWTETSERQYIAYAFFKHMQDSFRSVDEVMRQSLYHNGLVTMARRYVASSVVPCAHLLFTSIASRLGVSEYLPQFLDLMTAEIFQAYLSTEQKVTPNGVQAIYCLHTLQHPRFIALILQKLNAQSPTLLHENLTGYLCVQLQSMTPQYLRQVKSLLSHEQCSLIDLLITNRSPLTLWVKQQAWSHLSVALSQPQRTLIEIHLASAAEVTFPLKYSMSETALLLTRQYPRRLARLLIQFDLSGWETVLNEKIIDELQQQQLLTPLMMKLSHSIIENEYEDHRIPKSVFYKLNQKLVEESYSQSIVEDIEDDSWFDHEDDSIELSHQHYILLLKVIKHSSLSKRLIKSKRALLMLLFLLINFKSHTSKTCFTFFLSLYKPSRREPERLIKVLRLAYTLLQLDVNPMMYLDTEDLTLSQIQNKLTEIGQISLIQRLGLSNPYESDWQDHTRTRDTQETDPQSLPLNYVLMQDQIPALSHPITPIVLRLYANYSHDPILMKSLKLFYKHILKGQFTYLKYEHRVQQKIIDALCLSHPQTYAWTHKKLSWQHEHSNLWVEECDSPEQILNASITPVETCLSWRSGLSCRSLLSFAMDFHQRLVTFSHQKYSTEIKTVQKQVIKEQVARCFWRLSTLILEKEAAMPVLVIEPLYTNEMTQDLYISYLESAIKKGIQLRMPVIEPIRSYAKPFLTAKQKLLQYYDWGDYQYEWHLNLPGSSTGYELSDTLACFDLTVPAHVKVPAHLLFAHQTHGHYFKKL